MLRKKKEKDKKVCCVPSPLCVVCSVNRARQWNQSAEIEVAVLGYHRDSYSNI